MADTRDPAPELRRDPLSGDEVVVAPGRGHRPHAPASARSRSVLPERDPDCPLCPGNEEQTPPPVLTLRAPGTASPWSVRVVPNLFPIVSAGRAARAAAPGELHRSRTASGVHEVVAETPRHDEPLAERSAADVSLLLDAYHSRLRSLEVRRATRHVVIFENHGAAAGASLDHPHSQIAAMDFVPPSVRRRNQIALRYYRRHARCLLCDVLDDERRAGVRVVFEREGFLALAPYASRRAGEMLLAPLSHADAFTAASTAVRARSARGLLELLHRMRGALEDPPYNLVLYTAAPREAAGAGAAALHWYWRLSPRLSHPAGLELETELSVNLLPPEEAASLLRQA